MAIKPKQARRFHRSSPVARYWLAQCEGFRVKGPPNGTVEQVVGSANMQDAEALVVRSRGRRRNVPVAAVDTVVPAARLIVVDSEGREPTASTVARGVPRAAGRSLLRFVRMFALLIATGLVLLVRVLLSVALAAAGSRGGRLDSADRRPGQP